MDEIVTAGDVGVRVEVKEGVLCLVLMDRKRTEAIRVDVRSGESGLEVTMRVVDRDKEVRR